MYINGIIQAMLFSPLNIIPKRYIAAPILFGVAKLGSFSMPHSIALHTIHTLSVHSTVDRLLVCFQFELFSATTTIWKCFLMHICMHICWVYV